ncbi:MAG: DUF1501 domain-containing protein [bacterium]|nr:DUF1501 domain-containing protein [bacterium]MDI1334994.1 DUF1501 domain-containing protein [Lacunisphaera sp.]
MSSLHHSEDPRLWNLDAEFRLLGLRGAPMTRREAIRLGLLGSAGLLFGASALGARAAVAPVAPLPRPRAKSVIQIWLWGGPCHIDTFDPKPGAGSEFTGPLNSAANSRIPGMQLGELLPLLAGQADKYALIRNLSHNSNAHETASYMVQTGRAAGRDVFPGAGAVVSLFKGYEAGYKGLLPPYIVLTELQGRFSEAGFLGQRYKPFATGGDPAANRFVVEGVVAPGIDDQRQHDRRDLLHRLNTFGRATSGNDPRLAALAQCETEAYEMILGDAGKVFDLGQEKDTERERYGRNTFGQSCLLARRLVERGVPYVTINYKGWDTHKQHFQIMRRKLPEFDRGLATLLADLSDRGLLDQTVVWAGGEFGRTPRVLWEAPWNGGRGHYGQVFSSLVAGGGFRGGQVVGASDARGEAVVGPSVHPAELIASIYGRLGIDPDARLPHPEGLDVRAVPPLADGVRAANPLAAIL